MGLKNIFIFIIILLFPILVFGVEQNVTVEILVEPTICLGDNLGECNDFDNDATVCATLSNNEADQCQINWEDEFKIISPATTHTCHGYGSGGEKTVFYRCRLDNKDWVTVNDTIDIVVELPLLIVYSPNESIYNSTRVKLNMTTNNTVERITYVDHLSNRPRERDLCRNCDEYGYSRKRTKIFRDGEHSVTFKAVGDLGSFTEVIRTFFIDSKKPKIKKTLPKNNGYTNGSFLILWEEKNMEEIRLHYDELELIRTDCPIDVNEKTQTCEFMPILNGFDGEKIEYWFEIKDIANNKDKSKVREVNVDLTSPEITKLNYTINRRRVKFDIEVSEEVKLEYLDRENSTPRWRNLCNNCDSYNKKKTFRVGEHDLLIRATDKAMNSDIENINFTIF